MINGPCVILLDFGVVSPGWVQFTSPDLGDAAGVEVGISAHAGDPVKRLAPVRHGEIYRLEPNPELYEGVRFVWIHVAARTPWRLSDVRLICQAKPVNYVGSFACSDALLERIWYTGAYTVRGCYQQAYMGTILDDRGDRNTFSGDAHVAQAVSLTVFGNPNFVRQNIAFTPGPDDHNGILSYSLFWVLSIAAYVEHSDDHASVAGWLGSAEFILNRANDLYDTEFHQSWSGWDQRLGGGFEFPDSPQTRDCFKMLAIRAWREFATVLERTGQVELSERFRGFAARRIAELRGDPTWVARVGLFAALQAVNAGFTTPDEHTTIATTYGADPVDFTFISPFHQYFVLRALARMGRHDEAMRLLRDCWGGMLAHGATTCYELYRPELNAVMPHRSLLDCSLTHPWSAGATTWLSEEIAGIRPLAPGFARYAVTPRPGPGLERIAASVRTPHGDLALRLDTTSGMFELNAPPNTLGQVTIPSGGRRIVEVAIDGVRVWPSDGRVPPGCAAIRDDADGIHLDGVRPGWLRATIIYAGPLPVPLVHAARTYRAQYLGKDCRTGGSWGGRYGVLGYQLLTGNATGPLSGQLPDFVAAVTVREGNQALHTTCARDSTDTRVLAADAGNRWPREVHSVTTNPSAHSVWLKIDMRRDQPHALALYLLDWNGGLGRFAVEMYDAETLNLIAPTQVAEDAGNGCYMRFAYHRSSVIRIYRGALSGIFFDEPTAV